MKKVALLVIALLLVSVSIALAHDDTKLHPACPLCGMDRERFAHSRMLVEYDDGTMAATCSIHCMAVELANKLNKTPVSVKVGDFNTKDLIDAEKAVWVIGGSKPGVMTRRAKWAFGTREAADQFIKENGGMVVTYDEAMKATYEDMYADTKMLRDKRKMMRMKMQQNQAK
jgi:hypothetical protein